MARRGRLKGSSAMALLCPREIPFQTRHEIQRRRGESEYLLIAAVERVAQAAVDRDAAAKRVVEVHADIGETGVPEKPVARAERRLLEQGSAAEVSGRVGGDPAAGEG